MLVSDSTVAIHDPSQFDILSFQLLFQSNVCFEPQNPIVSCFATFVTPQFWPLPFILRWYFLSWLKHLLCFIINITVQASTIRLFEISLLCYITVQEKLMLLKISLNNISVSKKQQLYCILYERILTSSITKYARKYYYHCIIHLLFTV